MTTGAIPVTEATHETTERIQRPPAPPRRGLRARVARLEAKVDSLRWWVRVAVVLGVGQKVWEHFPAVKSALVAALGG